MCLQLHPLSVFVFLQLTIDLLRGTPVGLLRDTFFILVIRAQRLVGEIADWKFHVFEKLELGKAHFISTNKH